jgi:hypothetical protein
LHDIRNKFWWSFFYGCFYIIYYLAAGAAGAVVPGSGAGAVVPGAGSGAGAVIPVTACSSGFGSSAFLQPTTANDTVAKKSTEIIRANNFFIDASPPFKNFQALGR